MVDLNFDSEIYLCVPADCKLEHTMLVDTPVAKPSAIGFRTSLVEELLFV